MPPKKKDGSPSAQRSDARQIQQMFNLLDAHFDIKGMAYREDWSDEKIARAVLTNEGSVERYRIRFFGRLRGTSGMGMPGRVQRLEDQMGAITGILEQWIESGNANIEVAESVRSLLRSQPLPPAAPSAANLPDITKQPAFEAVVVPVILEHGKPMGVSLIREKLTSLGFTFTSENANHWVGNKLFWGSRAGAAKSKNVKGSTKPFVNIEGHGWWPITEPYEPAGYRPK